MSLPRLYLETTIPSYLVARRSRYEIMRGQQLATREWWEHRSEACELFVSQFVDIEAERGDAEMARARMAAIDGLPRLPVTESVRELASEIMESGLIPMKAGVDALHIAVAAVHGMDMRLTWNCTHINNVRKEHEIAGTGCAPRFARRSTC